MRPCLESMAGAPSPGPPAQGLSLGPPWGLLQRFPLSLSQEFRKSHSEGLFRRSPQARFDKGACWLLRPAGPFSVKGVQKPPQVENLKN